MISKPLNLDNKVPNTGSNSAKIDGSIPDKNSPILLAILPIASTTSLTLFLKSSLVVYA